VSSNVDDTDQEQDVETPEQAGAAEQPSEEPGEQDAAQQPDDGAGQDEGEQAAAADAEPDAPAASEDDKAEAEPKGEEADEGAPAEADEGAPAEADEAEAEPKADEAEAEPKGDEAEAEPKGEGAEAEPKAGPADKPAPAKRPTDEAPEDFVEDGRADQALDFVVDVLTGMSMDCTVDLMENREDDPPSDIRIEITGRDAERLIGKKGQTLAALQFLTNRVINRPSKPRRHILIDADGYRARREHALASMALRLAKQAMTDGKIITFEAMSAQDRRVVHLALASYQGVVTKSEGKGAARRVQIIPVRE